MGKIMHGGIEYSGGGSGGGGGSSTLAGLSDVAVSSPTDGQVLTYDDANDKWINSDASGGDEAIILTMAEYNALTPEQKTDPSKTYYVSDAPSDSGGVNYSTQERVIGTWIDGKKKNKKTFDLTSDVNIPSNTWTDVNISNSGMKALIYIICANNTGAALCGFSATLNTSGNNIRILQSRNAAVGVRYVTIQYTKNTD